MIERQVRTRPRRAPRRKLSPAKRRRRTGVIAVAGAGTWMLLAQLGLGYTWSTALALGAVGLLMAATYPGGKRTASSRRTPRRAGAGGEELPADLAESQPGNAFSEEYNTLAQPVKPKAEPPATGARVTPLPTSRAESSLPAPSRDQVAKMPPPVPPPLYGRPGLRPILAGHPVKPPVAEALVEEPPIEEALPGPESLPQPVAAEAPLVWKVEVTAEERASLLGEVEPVPPAPPQAVVPPPPPTQTPPQPQPSPPPQTPPRPPGAGASPAVRLTAPATTYVLPPYHMLPLPKGKRGISDDEILERAALLEHTLKTFGVEAKVIDFAFGPAVTRYELQPGPGVRVNKFTALTDDLALALAAEDIRIEAPIPGKSAVGIEVPNRERLAVPLREVLESPQFRSNPSKLAVAFGKDNAGNPVVGDLARMPHLLIAGSTGSGKSVCMNTIISSLLFKARPEEVKMLMIDPKMVELSIYNGIPHLMAPVITDVKKAAGFLKGAVKEMETRYELFAAMGVRNIQHYNEVVAADPGPDPEHPRQPLPYIVIFIDELADLMMVAPADVEDSICRLAQMARACGMHLVIATQSPRVDVITGLIKANVPSRIAFAVSSQIDSRVIMDSVGAERLLGRGDMLYHPSGLSKPLRAQGAFIEEAAVDGLVRFVKAQGQPTYTAEEVAVETGSKRGGRGGDDSAPASAADAVFPQAVRIVVEHGQASVSILQRRLRCNYSKASRLIDMMEERGFVGPHQGSRPREVLVSMAQWQEMFGDVADGEDDEA